LPRNPTHLFVSGKLISESGDLVVNISNRNGKDEEKEYLLKMRMANRG
jgi:hypothetical protein